MAGRSCNHAGWFVGAAPYVWMNMAMHAPLSRSIWGACVAWLLCAFVITAPQLTLEADEPASPALAVQSLRIDPATIRLGGMNRRQKIVVSAKTANGGLLDVTRRCAIQVRDPAIARFKDSNVVGVSDGRTELVASLGSVQARATVEANGVGKFPAVHFTKDVIPILSKLGCNAGNCHGKASGQNGFKLSVFGSDPQADYNRLVKEGRGRRLFPASPERSLLLLKATAQLPHGGGRRMEVGSDDHELLLEWVRQGMPVGAADSPQLVRLDVRPRSRVLGFETEQQILATATYSDGAVRDVSDAAAYAANSELIADVDQNGLVRTGRIPGEVSITVNYMGQVAAVQFQVPRPDAPDPYPELPLNNRIDALVWAKLQRMGILPSEPADDVTFLRRAYLDAIGTLPTPDEVLEFLRGTSQEKRSRLIEKLLDRDEFADYWALKWADILLVDRDVLGDRGAFEFFRWLRRQFAQNRPYDQWVRELVTATGTSGKNGPVNLYRALRSPDELARGVSQAFLGVRIECAQCHHHPFEKWAQEDFYGLAGFFNGMERKQLDAGRELIYHAGYRETRIPITDAPAPTRPLGGQVPQGLDDGDPRRLLADWMTEPANPWFARLVANRLWKHFLGRGLVEPEDDFRSTNPPTNPELLDYLASQVVHSGYDLKLVMRRIMNSRVYQLSSVPNETNSDDRQNFSHYYVKRLSAEVMLDAISEVTGVPESFPGRPVGTRAIELWDNRLPSYFLDIFGRPERSSPCECVRSSDPTMAQALHLMNAPEVQQKISSPTGRVAGLVAAELSAEDMIQQLCLAALGRLPRERERRVAEELFAQSPPRQAAEDLLWALLNSYDFLFVR